MQTLISLLGVVGFHLRENELPVHWWNRPSVSRRSVRVLLGYEGEGKLF